MLVLPLEQTQPLGRDYEQANYLQALGRWFVRGKSFALSQESAAKKYCQKILDAPEAQPFCILVKSLSELTLWHETQEVPEMPQPSANAMEADVPQARMFRGQVVHAPATAAPTQDEPAVKTYRGQVVQSQTGAVPAEKTVKSPRVYRGKVY
ncbi:MAG: hypothetical protein Q6K90_01010 [Gloeomargarita sp. HHBFW_bins_162]